MANKMKRKIKKSSLLFSNAYKLISDIQNKLSKHTVKID